MRAGNVFNQLLLSVFVVLCQPASGVLGEEQVFLVRPESVRVRASEDVILRCKVFHQQGNAQWTKDGFALGFGRAVPGYPRYRYAGDSTKGEHHLLIKGVTLQDDGEYQCQVGPTANASAIWASANVTVLVPPEGITINGKRDGAVVEVRAGNTLTLECLVEKGRPAPTVTWLRNGLRLDPDQQSDEVRVSRTPLLWNVRSRVRLRARVEDNGHQFTCTAVQIAPEVEGRQENSFLAPSSWNFTNSLNETFEDAVPQVMGQTLKNSTALEWGRNYTNSSGETEKLGKTLSEPLEVSVTLSVLYPPTPPVVSGYQEGDMIPVGETLNLTCEVSYSNPPPVVTWYRNGLPLSSPVTGDVDPTPVLNTSQPSVGLIVTEEVRVTRQDDLAVYECRVSNSLLPVPLTSNVTLNVQYPPSNVSLLVPEVLGSGNTVTLRCVTSPANPPANITWIIQGATVKRKKSSIDKSEDGGWVTSSTLTYRVPRSGNELSVRCMARNAATPTPLVASKAIQVIKTPRPPVVEADISGTVLAGTVLDLTCTTHGGHPPREVKMFKGDEEMEIKVEENENVTIAHSELKVVPADNKVKVVCKVKTPTSDEPLTGHTTINLFFPAWEVKGWVDPQSVEVKEEVILGCETSPSIPPSTVIWRSGGATLEGASTKQAPGKYGGTVTSSELRVRPLADDNGRIFTCTAENGLGVSVSANLTIDVLHGPRWVEVPASNLELREGANLILTAIAMANPLPVRYAWQRDGMAMLSSGISGGELRLRNVTRRDSANYTVTASSARGSDSYNFFIKVLFSPENVTAPERVTISKGNTTSLSCSAEGNPTPNVTWTRGNDNTSVLWWGLGEAKMVVARASRSDTGVYFCKATNSIGRAMPISTALVVTQAPWWPTWRNWSASSGSTWARAGGKAQLECRVRAAPQPIIQWQRQRGHPIYSNYKYLVQKPKLLDGLVEWSSVLEVRNVAPQDYGNYTCKSENLLGEFYSTHLLSPPPKPAVPLYFTILNVTSESAVLTWAENTNGGQPIGYTIKYWKQDSPNVQFLDIVGHNTTSALVKDLSAGTEYVFTILAYSEDGRSSYSPQSTLVTMAKGHESVSIREEMPEEGIRVPSYLLIFLTLAGTVLVALNFLIISCFVCRRSHQARAAQEAQLKLQDKVFSISAADIATEEEDSAVTSSYDVMHKLKHSHPGPEEYQLTSLSGDVLGRGSSPVTMVLDTSLAEASNNSGVPWREESIVPPDVCPRPMDPEEQDLASYRPYDCPSSPSRPSSPENHSDPSSQFHLSFNPSGSNSPSRVSGILLRDLAEEKLTGTAVLTLPSRSHSLHHCSVVPIQHSHERHHQMPTDSDVILLRSQLGVELKLPSSPSKVVDVTPGTSRTLGGAREKRSHSRSSSQHLQTFTRCDTEESDNGIPF